MTTPTTVEKKLLRIADVLEITSMSKSTLWRLVKTGQFPRAVESRRSERKSRALAARGHRGVDSRPAANLQRVTGVLSAASGRQV